MSFVAEFEDDELRRFLRNIDSRLKQVRDGKKKYIGLISAIVFRDVLDHFDKERGPDGKWKPWSTAYREAMEEAGYGGNKILQFSGRLRQNFKPTDVRSSNQGITWFNDAQTKDGFGYAHFHNETREFMWASDKAIEQMADQTLAFILEEGI